MRPTRFAMALAVVSVINVTSTFAQQREVASRDSLRLAPVGSDGGRGSTDYLKPTKLNPRLVGTECADDFECDDNDACTIDTCEAFSCVYTPAPAQTECDLDGNPCTIDQCDGTGACLFVADVDCSEFDDQCSDGVCDTFTGLCADKPKGPGTPCELDDNLCTWDVCDGNGACVFDGDVPCSGPLGECDGGKTCDPSTGTCVDLPDPGPDTPCDSDGDLCTTEFCDGEGVCRFDSDVICAGPIGPCDGGQVCDPATGTCTDLPDADPGTSCEADNDLCTFEVCDDQGNCVTDGEVVCDEPAGPCGGGEVCNPENGVCETSPFVDPGTPCESDQDLCTTEVCDTTGACVLESEVLCDDPVGPCDGGQDCDPATGACTDLPDSDPGTVCEADGDACTNEVCDETGACVFDSEVICGGPVGPCDGGQECDPSTGTCADLPDADPGTPCEGDDDLCTTHVCDETGLCVLDSEVTCPGPVGPCDGGQACDPATGVCADLADQDPGTLCEGDDDLCTDHVCDETGACVFDAEVTCSGPVGPCDGGQECDPATGVCTDLPDADPGTSCEADDDLCTLEVCDEQGNCVADGELVCNEPAGPCGGGQACDPATGICETLPFDEPGTPCDTDADLCTNEVCDETGACVLESEVTCPGSIGPCDGGEECDPATGACLELPDAQPGTACEGDDDFCTNEVCDDTGACVFESDVTCSGPVGLCDGGQECDPATGVCTDLPDADPGTPCEPDDDLCTSHICDVTGACVLDSEVTCSGPTGPCDGGQECDPATGTCIDLPDVPDGTSCDDGLFCNGEETCQSAQCEPGVPPCVDDDACTVDSCDEAADTCQFDCVEPAITCPNDLVFECDIVDPDFGDPTIDDDCSVAPVVECVEDRTPGKLPQEERIVRTCAVTNDCGNSAQCSYTIEIVDTTPPEVTCPPDLEFECDEVGEFGEPVVTDNCDPDPEVTIEVETIVNDCAPQTAGVVIPPKFTTTRTVTVSDGTAAIATGDTGNVTQCVQTIQIFDTTPPTIPECPPSVPGCVGEALVFTPPACFDSCGDCTVTCTRSDNEPLNAPVTGEDVVITCVAQDACETSSSACTIEVDTSTCAIPTVSDWGMAVLALLLLIAGKLYFGVRRQAPA